MYIRVIDFDDANLKAKFGMEFILKAHNVAE